MSDKFDSDRGFGNQIRWEGEENGERVIYTASKEYLRKLMAERDALRAQLAERDAELEQLRKDARLHALCHSERDQWRNKAKVFEAERDTVTARLAGEAELAALRERGWIVGNGGQTQWRCWTEMGAGWTPNRQDALRFARRIDAEMFCADDEDAWYVIEYPTPIPAGPQCASPLPTTEDRCDSCGEESPLQECKESKRPCGHHCNHSWSHDECCWCGATFGEDES